MSQKSNMTRLQAKIESGQSALIAEVHPPKSGDAAAVQAMAKDFAGHVHALGVSDNRDEVRMSALVAASLVAAQGVEPILHVTTRDRNRIALISDGLGASALGIGNVLCTTGTHQTLGTFRRARNVFDIDSVHLIQMYSHLADDGSLVGEKGFPCAGPFCVGGVAAPFADPLELQVSRLAKKVKAGARFLVTGPVFDLDRFGVWWQAVVQRGLPQQVAILAGVRVLTSAEEANAVAQRRPSGMIPQATLERMAQGSAAAQRQAGIAIACETVETLRAVTGLRGFDISAQDDPAAVLAVLSATGLKAD